MYGYMECVCVAGGEWVGGVGWGITVKVSMAFGVRVEGRMVRVRVGVGMTTGLWLLGREKG